MTVVDDLRSLEQRVIARLEELQPLVEEYKELEDVAKRLGIDTERAAPARAPSGKSSRRRRRTAAAPGQRRDQVLAMVKEKPGVTVPEIANSLGVDPTGLYRVVRTLQNDGQLKKEGRALTPA
jgi:hypothetical protein